MFKRHAPDQDKKIREKQAENYDNREPLFDNDHIDAILREELAKERKKGTTANQTIDEKPPLSPKR